MLVMTSYLRLQSFVSFSTLATGPLDNSKPGLNLLFGTYGGAYFFIQSLVNNPTRAKMRLNSKGYWNVLYALIEKHADMEFDGHS